MKTLRTYLKVEEPLLFFAKVITHCKCSFLFDVNMNIKENEHY